MSTGLIQNAIYFPEHNYYMPSTHVHDYQTFEYLPDHIAMVDGGCEYIRRTIIPPEHTHLVSDWSLDRDSSWDEILNKLLWGSLPLDKSVPQIHVYRPISTLDLDHLKAILKNVSKIEPIHLAVIEYWIKERIEANKRAALRAL